MRGASRGQNVAVLNLYNRVVLLVVLLPAFPWHVAGTGVAHAQEGEWSTPVNLSNTPTKSWIPAMAADPFGNVHVVWGEWLDNDGDWGDAIYYTMWNGRAWSEPNDILVSPQGAVADLPAIAADSQGRLHMVWEAQPGIFYSQAWIQDSPWLSTAWSPPVAISRVGRGRADIAVGPDDAVHIVWIDPPVDVPVLDGELCPDCGDVRYAGSSDGGQTWSSPENLSNSPQRAAYPFLVVDGQGVIHAAWDEHNAADQAITGAYSRSLDGGQTWSEPWDVGRDVASETLTGLNVGLGANGHVFLTWQLWHAPGLFLRWSEDRGDTWSSIVQLSQVNGLGGYGYLETAADSAENLFLAFASGSYENKEVYGGLWAGGDWLHLSNLSNSEVHSQRPRLAVSEGNVVHLVWFEHTLGQGTIHNEGNMEIWYRRLETGAQHQPPQPLPSRPPATATPEPATQATTAEPTAMQTPSTPLTGDAPRSSVDTTVALTIGMAATLGIMGLVLAGRLLSSRR